MLSQLNISDSFSLWFYDVTITFAPWHVVVLILSRNEMFAPVTLNKTSNKGDDSGHHINLWNRELHWILFTLCSMLQGINSCRPPYRSDKREFRNYSQTKSEAIEPHLIIFSALPNASMVWGWHSCHVYHNFCNNIWGYRGEKSAKRQQVISLWILEYCGMGFRRLTFRLWIRVLARNIFTKASRCDWS